MRVWGADLTLPPRLLQGTALECSFGQEEIFEAVWVNESAVRCNQVVVSGVALTREWWQGQACTSPDTALLPLYLPLLVPLSPVALPSSIFLTSPPLTEP